MFLKNNPTGTKNQFSNLMVGDGVATAEDVTRFVRATLDRLYAAGFLDSSTWDAMRARINTLVTNEQLPGDGFRRFERILTEHVGQKLNDSEFREIYALNVVEGFTSAIDDLVTKQQKLSSGLLWVQNNMPAGEDKVAILEAINFGISNLIDANLSYFARERDKAQEILDNL
jgi:hypothetical protein